MLLYVVIAAEGCFSLIRT